MSKPHTTTRTIRAAVALAMLSLCAAVSAAEPAWVTKSNANAKLVLNVMAKYAPESASGLGVDGYDEQITDLSRDHFAQTIKIPVP
ncbi:hypothetical protein [Massilia pseudoviolaceinigra]|uniref:hypothetical protein n=1 Tax=Massilia pseudoviolaceinigra TaxID=3057165 RepID=UPI0027966E77|nr:hypothetical protein [Massilia sp. CCM 9206]MDQ1921113.1 hypothetical protein [Massilia sp. CCM 9206]